MGDFDYFNCGIISSLNCCRQDKLTYLVQKFATFCQSFFGCKSYACFRGAMNCFAERKKVQKFVGQTIVCTALMLPLKPDNLTCHTYETRELIQTRPSRPRKQLILYLPYPARSRFFPSIPCVMLKGSEPCGPFHLSSLTCSLVNF